MSLSLCSFPFLPFPPLSVFLCLSVKQVIVRGLQSGRSCTQWELFLQTGTLAEDARRRVHSVLDFGRWTRGEPGTKLPNHTAPHRGRLGQTPNLQEVSKEKFRTLIWNHRNLNLKLPCKKKSILRTTKVQKCFFFGSHLGLNFKRKTQEFNFEPWASQISLVVNSKWNHPCFSSTEALTGLWGQATPSLARVGRPDLQEAFPYEATHAPNREWVWADFHELFKEEGKLLTEI